MGWKAELSCLVFARNEKFSDVEWAADDPSRNNFARNLQMHMSRLKLRLRICCFCKVTAHSIHAYIYIYMYIVIQKSGCLCRCSVRLSGAELGFQFNEE